MTDKIITARALRAALGNRKSRKQTRKAMRFQRDKAPKK